MWVHKSVGDHRQTAANGYSRNTGTAESLSSAKIFSHPVFRTAAPEDTPTPRPQKVAKAFGKPVSRIE